VLGTPFAEWSYTRCRWHPTRYGQRSPSATFSRHQDMLRSTDAQQLRRSKLQCCRPPRVEQFTTASTTRHYFARFKRQLKTLILFSISRVSQPRRNMSWLSAIPRHRNILTYLHCNFGQNPRPEMVFYWSISGNFDIGYDPSANFTIWRFMRINSFYPITLKFVSFMIHNDLRIFQNSF